jgi:hypothetical protein
VPGSPKWLLSLRFPRQNPVYISLVPHACYMPHPFHSSRFYRPNNIWWAVQIIKLLIMYFSPLPYYLVPLRSKYSQYQFCGRKTWKLKVCILVKV